MTDKIINTYTSSCRKMAVMKVETGIITSITASMIGKAVTLVILFVETFITDAIVFIGDVIMCLTSYGLIIFCIIVSMLILKISPSETKEKNIQITNKNNYSALK